VPASRRQPGSQPGRFPPSWAKSMYRSGLITGPARSRREWRVQRNRIGLHRHEGPPRFADTGAVPRCGTDPDSHHVPAMEPATGNGGLVNDNSVQQWLRGVGVWPGEQEPAIVPRQPGVQGLHAAEVRNLDEFRMPRLRVHKAAPQDQDTTVPAGPETIALLHYPGRRCQAQGEPPAAGRQRLASRQMPAASSGRLGGEVLTAVRSGPWQQR
jgi:hypothetical protein